MGEVNPVAALKTSGIEYPMRYCTRKNCEDAVRAFFKKHHQALLAAVRAENEKQADERSRQSDSRLRQWHGGFSGLSILAHEYSRASSMMKAQMPPAHIVKRMQEQHDAAARALQVLNVCRVAEAMVSIQSLHRRRI
jgi:hypothetical protein